jgi:putative addiction module component (TIGR02574 family)
MTLKSLTEEAVTLPPVDRALLIDALWESLATPEEQAREAAWAAESESRVDAVDRGDLPTVDAPAALRQLRASLGR